MNSLGASIGFFREKHLLGVRDVSLSLLGQARLNG